MTRVITVNDNIREDIATIKANVQNLTKIVDEFRQETRENSERMDARLATVEALQARQGERISNWNVFQVAFATIIGAIATYLGAKQ